MELTVLKKAKEGMGMIEIVVGVAIIGGVLWSLASVAIFTLNVVEVSGQRIRATFLASEGIEAVKDMRDLGWTGNIAALTAATTYYLDFDQAQERWRATTTNVTIDGFTRDFSVFTVYRDGNDDIASSGILDPGTRLVTVRVSRNWKNNNYSETLSTYIADILSN